MNDLTRRKFLQAVGGAAVGTSLASHETLLLGEASVVPALGASRLEETGRATRAPLRSPIFPEPREISMLAGDFVLDNQVHIVVPSDPSQQDLLLASLLRNELSDRFGLHLRIERGMSVSVPRRAIVMGSIHNPLVRQHCAEMGLTASVKSLCPEGYILRSNGKIVLVTGSDDRGAFYGLQSLRQLVVGEKEHLRFRGAQIRDWPDKPFRGIYMYLPGRRNIPFFKRFVSDFMALYKYNTLVLEMNACMRLESHPELNYGWVQFARDTNYSFRNYPPRAFHGIQQNSSHQDDADGGFLEKEEVADLARWVRRNHIELVPGLPSFTHSYYLLTEHRDLAAVPQNKWPDIYCPSNPKSYALTFEVYDEYIDVLKPRSVHIGHDELFLPVNVSPQCSDTDIGELFGRDVKTIHDRLASKGIRTHLWGDMLLQSIRGHGLQKNVAPDGWTYYTPGGLTPEQVERLIPKDCLIYNWFWSDDYGKKGSAEQNQAYLDKMGFQQIFGNFEPDIANYEVREKPASLLGGAPSAWFATNEIGFGKDLMSSFLGCSQILWTGHATQGKALSAQVQSMLPDIRVRLSGTAPPSQTETSIVAVDISNRFNSGDTIPALDVNLAQMATGSIRYNKGVFDLKRTDGRCAIVVGTQGKEKIDLPRAVTGFSWEKTHSA